MGSAVFFLGASKYHDIWEIYISFSFLEPARIFTGDPRRDPMWSLHGSYVDPWYIDPGGQSLWRSYAERGCGPTRIHGTLLYGRSKLDKDPTWIISVVPTRSHGALISTGGQGYKDPTRFLSVVPTRSHGALISTGGQGYKDPTLWLAPTWG